MIWGCPSLWSGRAVSQLAVRSALRKISLRSFCLVCGFAALLPIPQPAALWACRTKKMSCPDILIQQKQKIDGK